MHQKLTFYTWRYLQKICIILFAINNSIKWNLQLIGKWRKSNWVYLYERLNHSVGDNSPSCYNIDRWDLRPRNDHMGWRDASVFQFLVCAILFPGCNHATHICLEFPFQEITYVLLASADTCVQIHTQTET